MYQAEVTSEPPRAQAVYAGLRREIFGGLYQPGERLVEREIAVRYDVSRVPVREAIHRLGRDGLVDLSPKAGARVRDYTPEQVQDFYALRELLEGLAGRLAARRRTSEQLAGLWEVHQSSAADFAAGDHAGGMSKTLIFHRQLLDAADSGPLRQALEPLHQGIQWTLGQNHAEDSLIEQHRAVVQAVEERDEQAAEERVREHTRHGYVILLAGLTR